MDLQSDPDEKLKYPNSIWFIVLYELCERFSYFGLKTVLVFYLTTILQFDGDDSTIIYHSFVFLAYFLPLPGAILADSYWGKFDTIIRLSIVYALGSIILTGSSMANLFSLDIQKAIALLGLFLISVGTGGIKPCVFPFGGDQFRLPQQEEQLLRYATKFTIAINAGAFVSTFLTPELRHSVHCFGQNTCFPLAFGVPAAFMLIAIAIFVAGKNTYTRKNPGHNVISRTFGCTFYALRTKWTSSVSCKTHWLDNARGVYTDTEISDTKSAFSIITAFTTFPVFWALTELTGSRWTLQATQMNGRLEFLDWTIKPDQMQAIIPFFGLILLFVFDVMFIPLLAMVGVRKPFQKLTFSGCLAVIAFTIAALVQIKIFGKTTTIPSGEGHINMYNGFDCNVLVHSPTSLLRVDHNIGPIDMINVIFTTVSGQEIVEITLKFEQGCTFVPENFELNTTVTIVEGKRVSYYLTGLNPNTVSLNRVGTDDGIVKEKYGNPQLRFLIDHTFDFDDNITLNGTDEHDSLDSYSLSSFRGMNFIVVKTGNYNLFYNGRVLLTPVDLIPATFYTLILQRNGGKTDAKSFTMDEGHYIHILWQLPQFLCMITADVIFVVTSLELSFTEAPMNLKAFVSAASFMTTAIGNLLIVMISTISINNQAHEYLLYSGLMFADTLLLAYFSVVYRDSEANENGTISHDEQRK